MDLKIKHVVLILLFLLFFPLIACTDEGSGITFVEDRDNKPTYLSFFSLEDLTNSDVTKYWSDHFVKKYDKKVYVEFTGAKYYEDNQLSYRELLVTRMESSSPDDLYIINAEDVLEFNKKGYWMDLSGMDFVNNLSTAALYQSTYDGKVFSIPLSFTGFGFVWNMDLLESLNLTIPNNLAEFWNVCEKLKQSSILPYGANKGYGLTVPAMCVGLAELYNSNNKSQIIESLNSRKTRISEYLKDGFEFLSHMINEGYMDAEQALSSTPQKDDLEMFLAGKCGFICTGLGAMSGKDVSFAWKATGLPVLANGSIAVYGADKRLCVNPNSRNLNTALQFIEMVGTKEALIKSAQLNDTMPAAKDAVLNDFPYENSLVKLLQADGQIPNQDFSLRFNTWESIRDVSRILCAGATIEEVCELLDEKQANELLKFIS